MSPRSAIQNEKMRSESINKILDAAFKLFAKNGYESTSIAKIARAAGVSKGLMYNYFNSKEALLESLVNGAVQDGERIIESMMGEGPSETLEKLFRWFFDELRNNLERWKLITDLTLKIEKYDFVKDLGRTKMKEFVGIMSGLLEKNGVSNPKEEAMIIAALFDGIGIQYLLVLQDYPLDEMEKYLIDKYCK